MIFCTYTEIYIPIPLMVHSSTKFWILGTPSPWIPGWLGPRKWQFSVQLGHGGCSLDVRSCGALISASASADGCSRSVRRAKSGGRINQNHHEKNLVMPSEAIVTKQLKKGTHRNTTLYRKNHL